MPAKIIFKSCQCAAISSKRLHFFCVVGCGPRWPWRLPAAFGIIDININICKHLQPRPETNRPFARHAWSKGSGILFGRRCRLRVRRSQAR